jgi:hypothetical protein
MIVDCLIVRDRPNFLLLAGYGEVAADDAWPLRGCPGKLSQSVIPIGDRNLPSMFNRTGAPASAFREK